MCTKGLTKCSTLTGYRSTNVKLNDRFVGKTSLTKNFKMISGVGVGGGIKIKELILKYLS